MGYHLKNEIVQIHSCDIYSTPSGDMQYSASNPVRTEFFFSALHHGDYVLWAGVVVCGLWFVVCGCVLHLLPANILGFFGGNNKKFPPRQNLTGSTNMPRLLSPFLTELLQGSMRLPSKRAQQSWHIERMVGHGFC